jgi:hypothetical protein
MRALNINCRQTVVGLFLAGCVGGCAAPSESTFAPTAYPVSWRDLNERGDATAQDGYKLLAGGPTVGVFPGSLAVARVAAVAEPAASDHLRLDMEPPVDFLSWNSIFDDFRSISEVFPLNEKGLDGDKVITANLLTSAAAMDAALLLVYTEVRPSMQECELRGVLYDVEALRPLAAVHATAHVHDPITAGSTDPDDELPARREELDPRLSAVRIFQARLRECMVALMDNDRPGPRVAPEGWVPNSPLEPLLWPPYDEGMPWRR